MKKILTSSSIVFIAILLNVTLVSALTLGSVSGIWSNPVGGTSINYPVVGSEVQVRWGQSTGDGQSGLGFTGNPSLPLTFGSGAEFEIGTLRHFNHPIFPAAASAIDLTINLDFTDPTSSIPFTFTLAIDETPNAEPCVYPSSTPCADKITFPSTFPTLSESYWLNGKYYTLQIVGFRSSPGGSLVSEFISDEGQINTAHLYGELTTPPALEVPVDLRPGSCPNPMNIKGKGVISVAILGTDTFDPTQIDPATVEFAGVSPLRWAVEDAGMPYSPYLGKVGANDCIEYSSDEFGAFDGYQDLVFKFKLAEVITELGEVQDGDVISINLIGFLKEEFGGGLFIGEDVSLIIVK